MNTVLWIIQAVLAIIFLMAGLMKAAQPLEKLQKMPWTKRHTLGKIRFIGVSEILIALGLIIPWLSGILPILTVVSAYAIILVMLLAALEHLKHKEHKEIFINLVLLALAFIVAIGRQSAL